MKNTTARAKMASGRRGQASPGDVCLSTLIVVLVYRYGDCDIRFQDTPPLNLSGAPWGWGGATLIQCGSKTAQTSLMGQH